MCLPERNVATNFIKKMENIWNQGKIKIKINK